jgi:bacterioferritin
LEGAGERPELAAEVPLDKKARRVLNTGDGQVDWSFPTHLTRRSPMAQKPREVRKKNVIEVLNKARAMELLAIHQYMNQHYNLDNMDYGELAGKVKLIAIDEMRHAEMFAERIKELDGEPVTEHGAKVQKGQKVQAMFSFDAKLEDDTIDVYNQFAAVCRENGDSQSMKLFETIINDEQIHYNYFDNVDEHVQTLGDTFLAKIAGTPSATGLTPQGFAVSTGAA